MPKGYRKDGSFSGVVYKKGQHPSPKTEFKSGSLINFKTGRQKRQGGYIAIYSPKHPFAIDNRIFEHRIVMEKKIGRYLYPEEVVHHINKIVSDNRIENLMLFANDSEHHIWHGKHK